MVREHIESALNLRGKVLPSAEDALGVRGLENAAKAWRAVIGGGRPAEDEQRGREDEAAYLFSDYTEKLQSMFPKCETNPSFVNESSSGLSFR